MDLRTELERALALEDETERKLAVAAVVHQAVQPLGFRAVVIGGLAVEFWTQGEYTTADIDLYLPHSPDRRCARRPRVHEAGPALGSRRA